MTSLSPLAQEQIARLHRECIASPSDVLRLLRRAFADGKSLTAGVSRAAAIRRSAIRTVGDNFLSLCCHDFYPIENRHYYFSFDLDGDEFFFVSRLVSSLDDRLDFEIPHALYRSERRESQRALPGTFGIRPIASLLTEGRPGAAVKDVSRDGLGIEVSAEIAKRLPAGFELELSVESGKPRRLFAEVRNRRQEEPSSSWLGLSVSTVPNQSRMQIERAHSLFDERGSWRRISLASQAAGVGLDRVWRNWRPGNLAVSPSVISFRNQLGQEMIGLVNSTGNQKGAPVVLIPPAWGKTKETLLPLALSIVETCRIQGLAISVFRFDGTNRRGESFIDRDCRSPGEEYRRFRFSQAVEDLRSAAQFVRESEMFRAPSCLIVSFSLSTIEARRMVAEAGPGEIAGWIPVVGMVDLQSGLRAVSGGVDYAEGILKGVVFGRHELVGVLADMDFTGRDAIDADLVFKEDARRDMARIQVPITWFHGEHDAWIDVNRVLEVLQAGSASNRRLVQVPTGHQLRSSRVALKTFELIASEAVRMLWGRTVAGMSPTLRVIDRIRETEVNRRKSHGPTRAGLRTFWQEYLLGRDGSVGMDLLTATSTYREMMRKQIAALSLNRSSRVLDLGSGTGALFRELHASSARPSLVLALDLVVDALKRGRRESRKDVATGFVQADLDALSVLPLADESLDAVLASLLVSYLSAPAPTIREIRRLLRPGGRAVLSSLRRDADISGIYREGVAELVASGVEHKISAGGVSFAEAQRSFLNEAARLVDLEEQGLFRFYDEDELRSLVEDAGLRVVAIEHGLGSPPQAIIITSERPG